MIVATFAALTLLASQQVGAPTAAAPSNPAAPVTTATPPATATAPVVAEAEQICRRQQIEGSRRFERVCHTKADWDLIRANARNNQDRASRNQRDGG